MVAETELKPRKLTGRMQVELIDRAADRAEGKGVPEDASAGALRWATHAIEDLNMFDLAYICDCDLQALIDLDPDELKKLVAEAKKVNPLFFGMLDREKKVEQENMDLMWKRMPDLMKELSEDRARKWLEKSASKPNGTGNTSPGSAGTDTVPES